MSNTIHEEITFQSTPDRIYQVLTNSKQFSEMSGGAPTDIQNEAGGEFSCFGGMITGRMIELVPNERIVQAWRAGNWDPGVYSIAKFELQQKGSETILIFDHTGFPEGQGEHLKDGWTENYWSPLKAYLG
ncbi:SRPBCC family protein [Guptibacillus hwajinpoensis]|uniref:Activator of HSP90 ATPase n=1 Tax=Guptibacillus hwajinpoensis TaxID=208199 RepID=A0ABU0K5E7_9BACL|nr:SRPBCC family protein [Alkalihalobacillus hemicentroti]MDQ0483731.1 activator of HSP90 ATPase [Alkalihalobacillus hemicentroti]